MNGYVLLPVSLALVLTAAVALLLNHESGIDMRITGSQQQITTARYAAQAGLNHAAWLAQSNNCANYPNLASTPLALAGAVGSYSATIAPTSGSPVTISATGALADGTNHALKRSVELYQASQRQMILLASEDTYIDQSNVDKNFGAAGKMGLRQNSSAVLLKFDLAPIAPKAQVTLAQLELRRFGPPSSAAGEVSAHKVANVWIQGTGNGSSSLSGATWNLAKPSRPWASPGGDVDARKSAAQTVTSGNAWFAWDITDLIAEWLAQPLINSGVLLKTNALGLNADFRSSDAGQTQERPKLTINYRLPCGANTQTLLPAADAFINESDKDKNYGASTQIEQGDNDRRRVLVRFDTSSIAAGTRVNSAILRYYVSSIGNNSDSSFAIRAYPLIQSWVEGTGSGNNSTSSATWKRRNPTSNWATEGGDYSATAYAPMNLDTSSFASGWIEFDMTPLAQRWVDAAASNYGVILITDNINDTPKLNSKENASNRPQFVISY